jgi:hypothetical protein
VHNAPATNRPIAQNPCLDRGSASIRHTDDKQRPARDPIDSSLIIHNIHLKAIIHVKSRFCRHGLTALGLPAQAARPTRVGNGRVSD